MLSKKENAKLALVGPGTPAGKLLRRYWHPIAVAAELKEKSVKRLRILGEDLVLYRGADGSYGLVVERCAHRGASL
ncbi:MAG: Rieske 2Fe-2S domain-containing protein, partial [Deltaproteobacteria bacterium]|nr:Rieske 2Fe-2S domain-containing protein [Deltaproteobacteria bacterium]